jgi:hypothetical protein
MVKHLIDTLPGRHSVPEIVLLEFLDNIEDIATLHILFAKIYGTSWK